MLSRMRFEASFAFDALETKVKASAYPFLTCASLLGRGLRQASRQTIHPIDDRPFAATAQPYCRP